MKSPMNALLAIWLALPGFACTNVEFAAAVREGRQGAIIDGEPSSREAVVALQLRSQQLVFCSGTLITPRVVLTAAHCAEAVPLEDLDVFFGAREGGPGAVRAVSRANLHPQWDPYVGFDLALLELATPAPGSVTPVPHLPASLALGGEDIGRELVFAGYGVTEQGTSGERFETTGAITDLCPGDEPCEIGSIGTYARSFAYSHTTGGPCSGDSGGPAFIDRGGALYVAGINSAVEDTDDNCSRAEYGFNTLVDFAAELIDRFIAGEEVGPAPVVQEPVVCADATCTPGAACAQDADCGGTALCIPEEYGFSGGYCSSNCATDAHCSSGALCLLTDDDVGYCFAACDSAVDCREGYACESDGRGGRFCYPAFESGETPVGGRCEQHSDCVGGYCWSESAAQVPGGYCTAQCRVDEDCPGMAYCDRGACIASCRENSDCPREDFVCWPNPDRLGEGVCWLPCTSDAECEGEVCNEHGLCGEQTPPGEQGEEPIFDPSVLAPSAEREEEGCAATPVSPWLGLAGAALRRRRRRAKSEDR